LTFDQYWAQLDSAA
nr:Chain B, MDM2 in complex with GAR300-Am [synthetic construct]